MGSDSINERQRKASKSKNTLNLPGQEADIVQRCNDRQATYFANEDYRKHLGVFFDYADQSEYPIHAYVLMTKHNKRCRRQHGG